MSPGINDGPRYTGTVPKSNRRNDRNRERSNSNSNQTTSRPVHQREVLQQPNNLLDWHPVIDSQRSAKNSNTRSTSSAPSVGYQDLTELDFGGQRNYSTVEERYQWQRMAPPDSHGQSPVALSQGSKPSNVDKMPDRSQVEIRLNQIRDYIKVTSTMMESLSHSSDPRAAAQRDRLSLMVEDLYDSEKKLAKLLETYRDFADEYDPVPSNQMRRFSDLLDVLTLQERFIFDNPRCMNGDEHGDPAREAQLHQKVEETQQKLAQLQEQEASLLEMQVRAREQLNEARQAQQLFLNQEDGGSSTYEGSNRQQSAHRNPDQLESDQAALRGKLAQLQTKKKRMDHLMAELQAVEVSDRGSCSSENSRPPVRDKVAELDAMKAQLAHLKALMAEVTRDRNPSDSEVEGDENSRREILVSSSRSSVDRQYETNDSIRKNSRSSVDRPTIDQVQAVTRELKEQSQLLQAARAELQRLKPVTSTNGLVSTPTPSLVGVSEKKQSNNNNNNTNDERCDLQLAQAKRRQLEELMRKEQGHSSIVNQDVGRGDWGGTRDSNSQLSHVGVAANLWPLPTPNAESNEQSVDGVSTTDNLLDVGTSVNVNGSNGNWWGVPPPLGIIDHPQQAGTVGSAEYYRQLLLGSQAQQLQMMGMTMQQCCQLLWSQQRELQSMRAAIIQLQQQLRQQQQPPRPATTPNNMESSQEYSNLGRSAHPNGSSLDMTLPPSSSLPNLVAIPTPLPTATSNPPHQQQQQLNNQVPPGNRANNYWDNFRSYSRQNLLSVSGKSTSDRNSHTVTTTPTINTASSSSSVGAAGGHNTSLTSRKEKRNREHGSENLSLPVLLAGETQYSPNLQLQSNFQQQESSTARSSLNNVLASDTTGQQQSQHADNFLEEQHSASVRSLHTTNEDQIFLRQLSSEMREAVTSLVTVMGASPGYLVRVLREIKIICEDYRLRPHVLRALHNLRNSHLAHDPLVGWLQNETSDQTASESCQSSDDDSDIGTFNKADTNDGERSIETSSLPPPPLPPPPLPLSLPLIPVVSVFENATFQIEGMSSDPSTAVTPGYNEDLAEADQSRPEASHDHQGAAARSEDDDVGDSAAAASALIADLVAEMESLEEGEERNEDIGLDRVPTRLYHQPNDST